MSVFPEVIFTKAGKILFRDKGIALCCQQKSNRNFLSFPFSSPSPSDHDQIPFGGFSATRNADEWSKIMAFFYYGAAKPSCLTNITDLQENIPSLNIDNPVVS